MGQGTLKLCRQAGQKIILTLDPAADPKEALQGEGIEITVKEINNSSTQVRLGIRVPREMLVLREELVEGGGHLGKCGDSIPYDSLCN